MLLGQPAVTGYTPIGTISAGRIAELSNGMLHHTAHVRVNRGVVEHDVTVIVSPVFPHEVVGFSGGNKYLFPGVSGRELIDLLHWLGALITSAKIIGTRGITPVRALIDEAASMVPGERLALCMVTKSRTQDLDAMMFADPSAAWAAAEPNGLAVLVAGHQRAGARRRESATAGLR